MGVTARHEHRSHGTTNRVVDDGLREVQTLTRETVQVRSDDGIFLHETQGLSPHLIGHDDEEVGMSGSLRFGSFRSGAPGQQQKGA